MIISINMCESDYLDNNQVPVRASRRNKAVAEHHHEEEEEEKDPAEKEKVIIQ